MNHRICILGLGYIGLPTAGMFAVNGVPVLGVDINPDIVERIRKGGTHIAEPGLRTVIQAAVGSGVLRVSREVVPSEVFIIAVPTPLGQDRCADLGALLEAASMIAPHLEPGAMVIIESTIPPGTTEELVLPLLEKNGLKAARDFDLVHCPERVIPGKILLELVENDRIIGAMTPDAAKRAEKLYRSFVRGSIFLTTLVTAEMVKLMENSYRDVNIAFANELALICRKLGVDVWEAIALANRHPRVSILQPGPGVGGHCIAVDPWFIAGKAPDESRLIRTARMINDGMPHHVVERICSVAAPGAKVALWGMTYKADVDDLRESPSLEVASLLEARGFRTALYEPLVREVEGHALSTLEESVKDAHLVALLVGHSEFRFLNPRAIGPLMQKKQVLDTRNFLNRQEWEDAGFTVASL